MVSRPTAWSVAIVAMLTMTVSYIDRSTLAVLADSVTKALHITETQYGWLQSAFSIAYLVATPLSGWWIDRIGARRGLVASILVWTAVSALQAIAPGFGALFILRIALGLAEGPSFPGAAQTNQRILPPGERARGFGVLFTGSSIGGMIAPQLASYLFRVTGSWRIAFAGSALVGLVWIPLWIAVTWRRDVRAQLDVPPPPREEPRSLGPRIGGALREYVELLKHPNMIRALIAILGAAPVIGFVLLWAAKYLGRAWHVEQGDIGHYLWLPPLIFDVATIAFGDLASRRKRPDGAPPRLLFAIGVLLAATLAFLPLADTRWHAVVQMGIAMAGGGIIYMLVTTDLLSRMPPHRTALAGGTVASGQSFALIVTSPLIGMSVDRFHSFDVAVVVLGLWMLPCGAYWILKRPTESRH
ncbi:MAG TPA: MFS transporter [Kofleriaceae bacterium]|nr:MFS transporter [Kofleriaceae bacterium]